MSTASVGAGSFQPAINIVSGVNNENDLEDGGFFEAGFIAAKTKIIDALIEAEESRVAASPSDAATVETGNLYGTGGELYTFVHAMRMQLLNDPQHPLMSHRAQELLDKIVAHDSEVEAIARRITEECKAEESAISDSAEIVAEMARVEATIAARHAANFRESGDDIDANLKDVHDARSAALREAERRIRARNERKENNATR